MKGISEALTIIILMSIAVVIGTILWSQMYNQANIASLDLRYEVTDAVFRVLNIGNSTHTGIYFKIALTNIGSLPLTNTQVIVYENATMTHMLSDNSIVMPSNKIILSNENDIFYFRNENLDSYNYVVRIVADGTEGSKFEHIERLSIQR